MSLANGIPEWTQFGSCVGKDPEWWFPEENKGASKGKQVCKGCPVRVECMVWGFQEPHGTWGGLTRHERRDMRGAKGRKGIDYEVEEIHG